MKEVGPAIFAAQPIIGSCGVEDRRRSGVGEIRYRQQFRRGETRYDKMDTFRDEVAE